VTSSISAALSVLVGGGLGALFRYLISVAIAARYTGRFPLATFLINVTGSFLIGLLMALFGRSGPTLHPNWRFFLVTGVLGGYTTFSSFEYEALMLNTQGNAGWALCYLIGSVVAGLVAVWCGFALVRK
jgi:fluoride exporter